MIKKLCSYLYQGSILFICLAGFMFNIHGDAGSACGEFWYNNNLVWRVAVIYDGAKPVSTIKNSTTTLILPDIENGLFMLKVQ